MKPKFTDEASVSDFVPYEAQIAPDTVSGRDGTLFATWRLTGAAFETEATESLAARSRALNLLYRSLPAGAEIVTHRVRRPVRDALSLPAEPGFARDFAVRYSRSFLSEPLMRTEFYVTLASLPESSGAKRGKLFGASAEILGEALGRFRNLASAAERSLAAYGPARLAVREKDGLLFSDQLAFYNFLLTLVWSPVRVPDCPVRNALGNAQCFFSSDAGELQSVSGRVFFQGLEIKDFCQETEPGLLDGLLYPDRMAGVRPYPFVETQRFRVMGKTEAASFLKTQKKRLVASADSGLSQISAIDGAADSLANGDFALGEYSYSLLISGKTEACARSAARDAAEKLRAAGMLPVLSTLALPALFFSALPGNGRDAPRTARVTSMNFAHLAPFHGLAAGKRNGNPWGEALLLLRTPSSQPFAFNFHATESGDDATGRKALGNAVVIGTSGTGKTVFLNTCAAAAQKYRDERHALSVVFFDKDRGAETAVSALPKSRYFRILKGVPTGFNPFRTEPAERNLQFLAKLVTMLVTSDGAPVSASDREKITEAVRTVMTLPESARRLAAVPQLITSGAGREARENSLSVRLGRWVGRGDLAWVFDNGEDTLSFSRHENFGIDGTEFLQDPVLCPPVAAYLLEKLESALDGRRFLLFMDEFWMWLRNPVFSSFISDKLKTIRKQNGICVLATQSPGDVLASPVARDVIEQSATQIFLPNPRADRADYVNGFHVTEEEFALIRGLPADSHEMLVRQNGKSAVCKLDLSGFPELSVLSGTAEGLRAFERITKEIRAGNGIPEDGPVPESLWVPRFLKEIRNA